MGDEPTPMSIAARLCWAIDRNDWILATANILAALSFVAGCLAFYVPAWYVPGVSLFLVGSLVMVATSVADAYRRFGPSQ